MVEILQIEGTSLITTQVWYTRVRLSDVAATRSHCRESALVYYTWSMALDLCDLCEENTFSLWYDPSVRRGHFLSFRRKHLLSENTFYSEENNFHLWYDPSVSAPALLSEGKCRASQPGTHLKSHIYTVFSSHIAQVFVHLLSQGSVEHLKAVYRVLYRVLYFSPSFFLVWASPEP